jgi:pyruvate dehydrogenase E2 component (dihydrolipoamide acetyltransferase)
VSAETTKGQITVEEPTRQQLAVARRMAESKATAPDLALHAEAGLDAAVAAGIPTEALLVRACALALRDVPRANGAYRDARWERYSRVNVGVVVPGRDALMVPTIFDADTKDVAAIDAELQVLAERVRDGSITPPELAGGTFTLSVLDVRRFTPVINPPQAGILGAGAVEQRPVVRDGALAVGHRMDLTLVCDHRILYGPVAAELLARIGAHLERP